MKVAPLVAMVFFASTSSLRAQSVAERSGNIVYRVADGTPRTIATGGGFSEPTLSPDGHTVAFIHTDGKAPNEYQDAPSSLWVADLYGRPARRLFGIRYKEWAATLWSPTFSIDGRFVYVVYNASEVSGGVIRVDIATGRSQPVIDGMTVLVLRNGPYRGNLLVQRHKYWSLPRAGSYNPVDIVRPDGKVLLTVPGSIRDDGEKSLLRWLRKTGSKAS